MSPAAKCSPLLAGVLDDPAGSSQPALCDRTGAVTYGQLREDVIRVAAWLHRSGCSARDRIAVCLPKSCTTVELILGILAADAAYVPLNHRLPRGALRRILDDLQPSMVICSRAAAHALLAETAGLKIATLGGGGPARSASLHSWCRAALPDWRSPPSIRAALWPARRSAGYACTSARSAPTPWSGAPAPG